MPAAEHRETDIEHALRFTDEIHDAARNGWSYEALQAAVLASARSRAWYSYMTIEDAEDWNSVCRFLQEGYEPLTRCARFRSRMWRSTVDVMNSCLCGRVRK